jgi:hypothetical protein
MTTYFYICKESNMEIEEMSVKRERKRKKKRISFGIHNRAPSSSQSLKVRKHQSRRSQEY